jgi:hypothetical protein
MLVLLPEHMVADTGVTVTTGIAFTVIVRVAVAGQPLLKPLSV